VRRRLVLVVGMSLLAAGVLAGRIAAAPTAITLTPASGASGTSVTVRGTGFGARESITLTFDAKAAGMSLTNIFGGFSATIKVPTNAAAGAHKVTATGSRSRRSAQATFAVTGGGGGGGTVDWPQFRFDQAHTGFQPFESVLGVANVPNLQLKWQAQLGKLVDYSSPAVVGGVVYIGSTDGTLWAYPAGGCGQQICTRPLWHSISLAQIMDSPAVANGFVYVGTQTSATDNAGKLDVFKAGGCGQPVCASVWQGDAGPQSILQSSPAVVGGRVYIGSFDGKLYAFDAAGCGAALCRPLWTGTTGDHIESSPTVSGNTVFVGSNDGNLYAFPAGGCGASTCAPLWVGPTGETIFDSTPAVANGTVYIGSVHHLSAFPAAGCGASICQPLWQASNGQDFVDGSPAVAGGRVFIGLETEVGVFDAAGCGQRSCGPLWLDFGTGTQAAVLSSPTVANGVVYAGKNNGDVLAWRAAPCGQFVCDQIWSFTTKDPIVSSSPTVVNGTVYIGGSNNIAPESTAGRLYVFALP
jgi:outer membrane protein assembly factor BamB